MELAASKKDIFLQLQNDVLALQGFARPLHGPRLNTGLGLMEKAFPNYIFPTGALHEFISSTPANAAATSGFMCALISKTMVQKGTFVWISPQRNVFPPALKAFGIPPERIVFINYRTEKEALWVAEEALKCKALAGVVAEVRNLGFTNSRRLQLAVEKSRVTGFIHRHNPLAENTTACVTRWKINHLPGITYDGLPGVGFPQWQVHLQKVRNGTPGQWQVQWSNNSFSITTINNNAATQLLKTG